MRPSNISETCERRKGPLARAGFSVARPSLWEFEDLGLGFRFKRLMTRPLMPEDLAQIALVDRLATCSAIVEVKVLVDLPPSMQFARNRGAKVR